MKYTPEKTQIIIDRYKAGASVTDLAEYLGVSERSIIAKLSLEGVYQKKGYLNKLGEPPVKKEIYVEKIAELLGKDLELCESLEKVNKQVLKWIIEALEK